MLESSLGILFGNLQKALDIFMFILYHYGALLVLALISLSPALSHAHSNRIKNLLSSSNFDLDHDHYWP